MGAFGQRLLRGFLGYTTGVGLIVTGEAVGVLVGAMVGDFVGEGVGAGDGAGVGSSGSPSSGVGAGLGGHGVGAGLERRGNSKSEKSTITREGRRKERG